MTPRHCLAVALLLAGCAPKESKPAPAPAPGPVPAAIAAPAPPAAAEPGFDLRVVRQFDVGTADLTTPPAAGTVDGDYLDYGGGCGYLYKSQPREAIVIVCNGEITAGPITDVAQAKEALDWMYQQRMAQLNQGLAEQQAGFEMGRRVRQRWPTGGSSKTRVYGADGTWLYDQ